MGDRGDGQVLGQHAQGVAMLGALADATAVRTALVPLVALPAIGWLLVRGLREPGQGGTAG
ncbi:hypothetical protein ACFXAZ_22810 [Streptomyces sp. NPDC059477]|uniref:hypothetical protein n=1 Tax=Streptomyces sp. NPDC059477 TaxID=3346847 RepID=UPI0036B17520